MVTSDSDLAAKQAEVQRHVARIRVLAECYETTEMTYDKLLWEIMVEMGGPDNITWQKDRTPPLREEVAMELRKLANGMVDGRVRNLSVLPCACQIIFGDDD